MSRGFTLLEVVVALAIIAIALASAVTAVSGNTRNAAGLQQRTYAHWVAMNKQAEVLAGSAWPELGETHGEELLARHTWYWTMKVTKTPNEFIRRVEVTVRAREDEGSPQASVTSFVGES
jgi:general secretion pathway protein I